MTDSASTSPRDLNVFFDSLVAGDVVTVDIVGPHLLDPVRLLALFERLLEQNMVSVELLDAARALMDTCVRANKWHGGTHCRIVLRVTRSYICPFLRSTLTTVPISISRGVWESPEAFYAS